MFDHLPDPHQLSLNKTEGIPNATIGYRFHVDSKANLDECSFVPVRHVVGPNINGASGLLSPSLSSEEVLE